MFSLSFVGANQKDCYLNGCIVDNSENLVVKKNLKQAPAKHLPSTPFEGFLLCIKNI